MLYSCILSEETYIIGVTMKKKIEILGLPIDNYSVREAILLAEGYLNSNSMSIIETVSMRALNEAETSEAVAKTIEEADLTVIGEKEILTVAGIMTPQREKEITEHEFFHEFMKRVVRNHKRIYLIAQQRDVLEHFEQYMEEGYPKRIQVGSTVLDECSGGLENVINEVNGESVDVLISLIPSPVQEEFICECKDKLSTQIWYGLGAYKGEWEGFWKRTFRKLFHKRVLLKKIDDYQNENEEKQ